MRRRRRFGLSSRRATYPRSRSVAVVAGGSTGIGETIAEAYPERGAEVVIASRSEESGRETAEALGCAFVQCNVIAYGQVEALVDATVDEYGRLDAMVNNAGIGRAGTVEETSLDDRGTVIDVNLPARCTGRARRSPT